MNLSQLKVSEKCKVIKINGEGKTYRRLLDMGVTVGVEITVRKKAPLNDPIEIHLRGYELTLRLEEADLIEVLKI